jgi:hypothetical protein
MSEPHVEDISNEEHHASEAEVFTQHIKLNSPT